MDLLNNIIGFLEFFTVPVIITFWNVRRLVREVPLEKEKNDRTADIIMIVAGLFLSDMIMNMIESVIKTRNHADWNVSLPDGFIHAWLHTEYRQSVLILIWLGIAGLVILSLGGADKTPPLISAISISLVTMGCTTGLFCIIQLMKNFNYAHTLIVLYWVNAVLISAKRIRQHIVGHVQLNNERETVYRNKLALKMSEIMSEISTMSAYCFLMIIPAAAVLEIIFILIGQGADGVIKAFTETADWTFSQQIPAPPSGEYTGGHYLCTVAAGGHKKIVKPLRYGRRRGNIIVVNRQLLASNAFEDLIAEKLPKFHRAVRSFYDKHGYPMSKHITTRLRADIVYIVMKPLEWLFILTLYLFDTHPENRIAVQYSDYKRG